MEVISPALEVGDVGGRDGSGGFAEEAFDGGAIGEGDIAKGEGRGSGCEEDAEVGGGDGVNFDFDGSALGWAVEEAGFGRGGIGESEEAVSGGSCCSAEVSRAELEELGVEGLATEVSAADCEEGV